MTTSFSVDMEASFNEFHAHILDINRDFKENVIKKVYTVKLNDQDMLNKKVSDIWIETFLSCICGRNSNLFISLWSPVQ